MVFKKETMAFVDNEALLRDLLFPDAKPSDAKCAREQPRRRIRRQTRKKTLIFCLAPGGPGGIRNLAPAVVLANTKCKLDCNCHYYSGPSFSFGTWCLKSTFHVHACQVCTPRCGPAITARRGSCEGRWALRAPGIEAPVSEGIASGGIAN